MAERKLPMYTGEVAALVGRTVGAMGYAITNRRLDPPPAKDSTGRYIWFPEDVQRLREALAKDRRYKAHRQARQTAVAE